MLSKRKSFNQAEELIQNNSTSPSSPDSLISRQNIDRNLFQKISHYSFFNRASFKKNKNKQSPKNSSILPSHLSNTVKVIPPLNTYPPLKSRNSTNSTSSPHQKPPPSPTTISPILPPSPTLDPSELQLSNLSISHNPPTLPHPSSNPPKHSSTNPNNLLYPLITSSLTDSTTP
ncbi:hypothetical protein AYI70_g7870, partial [Smittium culicis]